MFCKRGSNDRNKNSLYNLVNKERWVQLRTPLSFPWNIPNITSKALLFRFGMCVHMLSAVSRISSAPWLHLSEAGVSCAGWNRTMLCCLWFFLLDACELHAWSSFWQGLLRFCMSQNYCANCQLSLLALRQNFQTERKISVESLRRETT